ncbi:MAG: transketolase [Myxococcales bacterium]
MPNPLSPELQQKCVNTIRMLAVDAIEKANSGHPGLPMGAATLAFVLWSRHLRFDPGAPRWANRDRFILSAGHGSMLLYALLHLAGFDLSLDDLKSFRQLHAKTPGHPEFRDTPGVEATTGPLGQGIANAVGFALSSRMLAARLNPAGGRGFAPIDHYVYGICSDGDLMEGVAAEAVSLAGHWKLGNLIFLYDDNHISLAGPTELTFTEDRDARFRACGWHVQHVADGNDAEAIDRAIRAAQAEKDKPSLISVRTVIGYGSPNKANSEEAHGSPLGKEETKKTKENLGWPLAPTCLGPDDVRAFWKGRVEDLRAQHEEWKRGLSRWQKEEPAKAALLEKLSGLALPADLGEQLVDAVKAATAPESTRKLSQAVLQKAAELVPSLVGGSADLDPSTFTYLKGGGDVQAGSYQGRNLHFGVREHAMGSIVNGFAYDGFFLPYTATFLPFADYMRPPMRLAALSRLRSIFVFTHDSIFLGEDGPTHQPIEQLATLRAIPFMEVWRPADAVEVAASWTAALTREDGPSTLVFSRQKLPLLQRAAPAELRRILRGAYALVEPKLAAGEEPALVVIATGSEVALAQEMLKSLKPGLAARTRIVSMPCVERFLRWPRDQQRALIPHDTGAKLVAVEAAGGLDWYRIVGDGMVIGIDRFGASAPEKALADAYGLTPAQVAAKVQGWIDAGAKTNA